MWRKDRGSLEKDGTRVEQIAKFIEDVIRRRKSGLNVTDEAILHEHPGLMPELGERLRLLRGIQSAARQARQSSSPGDERILPEPALEESRRFLQESLPGYEVFEEVHYGGQGVVYKAFQIAAKRTVAIKVLLDGPLASARQRHRFEREVELISRLRHPNIVTVYDSGLIRGRHYCVMEFVEGQTIDDYVLVEDLTVRDVVLRFLKICRAVGYAHQHGVIHRDLNPANILVDMDGEPHVLDFGLAKDVWASGGGRGALATTAEGICVGTLPYLSPEQAGGLDGQVDVRSDVYSLGVTLFKLLTGVFPYPIQDTDAKVRGHIISTEPLRLRKALTLPEAEGRREPEGANQDLETILAKVLAKEKDHRYRSTDEFADDLERYLAGDAVQARVDSRFYVLHRTLRKHRAAVAVASLFFLVLLASTVAVTLLWTKARAERENAREVASVAHSALGNVVTQVEGAIRPLAGGVQVRDELLKGVSVNLERLRPLVEADATMEGLLATLREKEGDIAFAQGRRDEAARHFEASLAIVERHAKAGEPGVEVLCSIARAYRKIANSRKDPISNYQSAIGVCEALLKRDPESLEGQYEACLVRLDMGQHLLILERYEEAVPYLAVALSIAEHVIQGGAAEQRWYENLAKSQAVSGRVQQELGNGVAAEAAMEAAKALRERMILDKPADTEIRFQLMLSYSRLGDFEVDAGRLDYAKELLRKGVDLGNYLTQVDPSNATWKSELGYLHLRMGQTDYFARDLEEAQLHSDACVALAEALVPAEPNNLEWKRLLASAYTLRGDLRTARRDLGGAYEDVSNGLAIRQALAEAVPDHWSVRCELATGHDRLAMCYRAMNLWELALQNHQRAFEIRKKLLEQDPATVPRELDIIVSLLRLATWHIEQKTLEHDLEALEWLDRAEASLNNLRKSGKLAGREGMYEEWMDAFQKNRAIVIGREERRACAEEEQSESTPASSPAPAP
jgi:tetratricopeptide (TPR) repeat protein